MEKFGVSEIVATLGLSIFVLKKEPIPFSSNHRHRYHHHKASLAKKFLANTIRRSSQRLRPRPHAPLPHVRNAASRAQRDLLLDALRLRGAATPDRLRREHGHAPNLPVLHWILRLARSRNRRHHCRHVPAVEDRIRDLHLGRVQRAGPAGRRVRSPGKRLAVDHPSSRGCTRLCL